MDNPWKCPACGVWNAPGITSHRCPDDACTGGGVIIVGPRPTLPGFWRCGVCQCDVPVNAMHSCGGYAPSYTFEPIIPSTTNGMTGVDVFAGTPFVVS